MERKNHSSKCFMADSSYGFAWRMECGYQRILSLLFDLVGMVSKKIFVLDNPPVNIMYTYRSFRCSICG